jgi:hypothetical protein
MFLSEMNKNLIMQASNDKFIGCRFATRMPTSVALKQPPSCINPNVAYNGVKALG